MNESANGKEEDSEGGCSEVEEGRRRLPLVPLPDLPKPLSLRHQHNCELSRGPPLKALTQDESRSIRITIDPRHGFGGLLGFEGTRKKKKVVETDGGIGEE